MVKTAAPPSFTFEHYLESENRQPLRHEFIRGE